MENDEPKSMVIGKGKKDSVSARVDKFDTKNVVMTLESLMLKVTKNDCTPDTVNAACHCAGKIVDLLKLHLEVERLFAKMNRNNN